MKRANLLLILLLGATALSAQELPRHIEVSGLAEVRQAPDRATITIGVETWSADLVAARQENTAKVNRLLAVPARFSIAAADVKTDFASVQPEYDMGDRGQIRAIVGYRITQVVSVVVRDLKVVDSVVTAAFGAGANRLDGVVFGLNDPSKASAEARLLAARAARAKAEALASELGVQLGRVLLVTDGSSDGAAPQPRYKVMNAMAGMEADGAGGDSYAPGQMVITAQVGVWFELKD